MQLRRTRVLDGEASFREKVAFSSYDYLKCCAYLVNVAPGPETYTKRLYSKLIASSHLLEDLLDFHGAKNNRNWYFYRELSAAVRHLSRGAYAQKHIFNHLPFYGLGDTPEFVKEGAVTHEFLVDTLRGLAPVILEEARRLEIPLPQKKFRDSHFPRISTAFVLKADIDESETNQKVESVLRVAAEFQNIVRSFEEFNFYDRVSMDEIKKMIPARINEVGVRRWEMVVHNLQSEFDSYVIYGGYGSGRGNLHMLRGFISVVLHLLEMMGMLLHLYERHLHGVGLKNNHEQTRVRLCGVIDPERLLDRAINFGLYFVCEFLTRGRGIAHAILSENLKLGSIAVGIPEKMGFHSRPSMLVAKIVHHYGGQVEMLVGQDRFDASSVLDLQWAGGKVKKEKLHEVVFEGNQRALQDIAVLASVNYGEDTFGKGIALPRELDYLR